MPSPHPRIRSWHLALVFLASFVFSGCTVNLDRVDQPTLAGTRQAVTGRMDMEIVSGGTAEARAGWVAVLMPADWTVATSTYYVSPLRATDTQTNLVATTTLDAPMEAPDGYQWFMAHTPGTESPISGRRYMAVINMVTGDALGTYTLRYYAGEPDSSWTSSATQTIEVRSNPCGEESSPSDADGDGYREIYTLCQLQDMQDDLTANYELMADLDVNAVGNELFAASGVGFMPVGSVATPFSGRFDGHHRTITGLRIYRPDAIGVGLFGSVTGRVMNLRVVGAGVTGANAVGVIAGSMSYTGSFLQEVSVTGHATGTDMVGGLVGNMLQGTIERSYADVDVSSVEGVYIGGLVGTMTASRLENVYSTGEIVTSGRYVGGLVGYDTTEAAGSILQSYAVGSVIGNEYVGGLAGYNDQDDIAYSFSAAVPSVLIDTPTLGGLVGGENLDETAFLYTHNYWFAEGDIPTIGIGNYSEHTSSTKWEVIDSPSAFKGAPSNAPFTTGGVRRWDPSIWSFPSGAYPKLVAFSVFSLEYTAEEGGRIEGVRTQSVRGTEDASSVTAVPYSGYRFDRWSDGVTSPVRTDTGVREDIAVSAQFVPDESSGGGAAVGAWMRPPMVGSGARNVTVGAHQPLGSVLDLGAVTTSGVNVVTYLSNTNRFQYFGRSFEFLITHLDLVDPTVELRIVPTGHSVRLRKGESVAVRLGNDEFADVRFTFSGLEANQVEMTLAETAHASSVAIPIADPVPFLAPSSGAVLPVGLTRVLRFGMRGEDVRRLQAFLNRQGFLVASTGPGSPGNETTYFGFGTRSALVSFQRKYGLAPFPGFVGERTRIGINRLGR